MTTPLASHVRARRRALGLPQADLAARVGVSRQALSAIEAGRQVPSTALALQLARGLGCTVEDLFSLPDDGTLSVHLAAPITDGRVVLAQVHGDWVGHPARPDEAADALVATPRGDRASVALVDATRGHLDQQILVAGCAPLLGVLAAHARQHGGVPVRWVYANSRRALDLLARGYVHLAGIHLAESHDAGPHHREAAAVLDDAGGHLVQLARWEQGLVVAPGNPMGVDRARLLDPAVRVATRAPGAGAQRLLERLWATAGGAGVPLGPRARDHAEVARLVRWGLADTGVAIAAAARAEGLGFVSVAEERFDLVVPAVHAQHPSVARLLDQLAGRPFRDDAARLDGYDLRYAGHSERVAGAA